MPRRGGQQISALTRVAIANRLAVAQCRKAVEATTDADRARWQVSFDFASYRSLPIVQLRQQQAA